MLASVSTNPSDVFSTPSPAVSVELNDGDDGSDGRSSGDIRSITLSVDAHGELGSSSSASAPPQRQPQTQRSPPAETLTHDGSHQPAPSIEQPADDDAIPHLEEEDGLPFTQPQASTSPAPITSPIADETADRGAPVSMSPTVPTTPPPSLSPSPPPPPLVAPPSTLDPATSTSSTPAEAPPPSCVESSVSSSSSSSSSPPSPSAFRSPPMVQHGTTSWEVEEIVEARQSKGRIWYRVKWKEFNTMTWEDDGALASCKALIDDFHRKQSNGEEHARSSAVHQPSQSSPAEGAQQQPQPQQSQEKKRKKPRGGMKATSTRKRKSSRKLLALTTSGKEVELDEGLSEGEREEKGEDGAEGTEDEDEGGEGGEGAEWEVEAILSDAVDGGVLYYEVKWVGWSKPTWEPEDNLAGTADLLLAEYQRKAKAKSKGKGKAKSKGKGKRREKTTGKQKGKGKTSGEDGGDERMQMGGDIEEPIVVGDDDDDRTEVHSEAHAAHEGQMLVEGGEEAEGKEGGAVEKEAHDDIEEVTEDDVQKASSHHQRPAARRSLLPSPRGRANAAKGAAAKGGASTSAMVIDGDDEVEETEERKDEEEEGEEEKGKGKAAEGGESSTEAEESAEEAEVFEVEKIVDVDESDATGPLYLVKWKRFPNTANTWEPAENLIECQDLVDAFRQQKRMRGRKKTRLAMEEEGKEAPQTSPPSGKESRSSTKKAARPMRSKAPLALA